MGPQPDSAPSSSAGPHTADAAGTADAPGAVLGEEEAARIAALASAVRTETATALEGKPEVIDVALVVLLSGGHLLIEDVPGVGKTVLATSLGATLGAERHRIQFTPDLLPSDVTGASIFDQTAGRFEFRAGPVFTHVLLADEINRASPKTQSALLEAMEERQVSVDGHTYGLPEPFMVIATANPVEMEGTYRLPEAQRDRFTAQISVGYPTAQAEARMLAHQAGPVGPRDRGSLDRVGQVRAVTTPEDVARAVRAVRRVHAAPALLDYVVRLGRATREHPAVMLGASPRAGVHLVRAAKSRAATQGRTFIEPEDVRTMLAPVWTHRLHLAPRAAHGARDAHEVITEILRTTPVQG